MIISLGLLMPVTINSINLRDQPDYLQKHKRSSINYQTCEPDDTHDDYPDADPGDACYYTHYEKGKTIEEEFPGVRSCCPFHGHLSTANGCQGRDKAGNEVVFDKAEVCVKPIEGQDNKVRKVDLNCSTTIVRGKFDGNNARLSTEHNVQVLHVDNKTFTNFCIGIKCDSDDEYFERQYEACEEKDALRTSLNGIKCCGEGGNLHIKKSMEKWVIGEKECFEGAMSKETKLAVEDCNGKMQVVLEDTTTTTSGTKICETRTREGDKKAVCINECETNKKCAQLCMNHGDAVADGMKTVSVQIKLEDVFPGTLFVNASLNKHVPKEENVILYPNWRCQDAADIQEDGSFRLKEKRSMGEVLHYGEFCIEPLDQAWGRGEYRLKTSWVKKEDLVKKEYVYYSVVLSISIVCLIATIAIYGSFYAALLRTMYTRIMINFAGSLLLAFLSLVVMQNLPGDEQTKSTCIGITLLNQFAILSSFSLMTLMSYNIFIQLYKFTSQTGIDDGFTKRVALCYIVPGLITLLTLIVELTAPRCASVRPKFGTKSCHFYGGVDKFLWLYLPILLLLLVNTGMFIYILTNICKAERSGSDSTSGSSRNEKRDKMLIYIRLFLGMGITWYFEILNFALSALDPDPRWLVLTDTLNMCQGVWVFIIFVCKKNVFNVVKGKSNSLYNTIAKQMSIPMRPSKSQSKSQVSKTYETGLSMSSTSVTDPNVDSQN